MIVQSLGKYYVAPGEQGDTMAVYAPNHDRVYEWHGGYSPTLLEVLNVVLAYELEAGYR